MLYVVVQDVLNQFNLDFPLFIYIYTFQHSAKFLFDLWLFSAYTALNTILSHFRDIIVKPATSAGENRTVTKPVTSSPTLLK